MARLLSASSPAWVAAVMADFDTFLGDHANCERKAAAMALALVSRYGDQHTLVDAMLELAQEELAHFHGVYRLMAARGLPLVAEVKDGYVGALRRHIRDPQPQQLLDHLVVAGVVEARGCERFGLVAEALPAGDLKAFYQEITRSEARHGGLFLRLARHYFAPDDVAVRLTALLEAERDIVAALPHRPALH